MTTPDEPRYDPSYTQPAGTTLGTGPAQPIPVRTVRRGPGWGTYVVTIIALIVVAAVIVFVLQNTQRINIKFLSWKETNVKTAVALGAAGAGGLIAGLFLGLIPWVSARRKLRSLRRGDTI
jgi:lipopolysaccharide assembly protein A